MANDKKLFVSLSTMATRCGVSESWLRAEALAGRIPHLIANRRLLFNPQQVEAALVRRAESEAVHA